MVEKHEILIRANTGATRLLDIAKRYTPKVSEFATHSEFEAVQRLLNLLSKVFLTAQLKASERPGTREEFMQIVKSLSNAGVENTYLAIEDKEIKKIVDTLTATWSGSRPVQSKPFAPAKTDSKADIPQKRGPGRPKGPAKEK